MVELTEREQLIVYVMYTILNPELQYEDFEGKKNVLYALLGLNGINTTDDELVDLVNACNGVFNHGKGKAFGILARHGFKLKGLKL